MEIGVRDLRNRTALVIAAVNAGERVTLSVHGEPVADIVPHGQRTALGLPARRALGGVPACYPAAPLPELPEPVLAAGVPVSGPV